MNCRHCGSGLTLPFVDLSSSPPSNAYLDSVRLQRAEMWFPLRVMVCSSCWLVQTEDFADADELFDKDYAYFSGFSSSWLSHCQAYVTDMVARFGLDGTSKVVEIAANDGSLLQYVRDLNIPCLGIEPTASTVEAARAKGIEIVEEFFGFELAKRLLNQGHQADLIAANNVLAHVPNINDFLRGFTTLLAPTGVATFEFPHLLKLVEHVQFDTIYHEHYSYLSLCAVRTIFAKNGLSVFDVDELSTHGGSLRVFAQRSDAGQQPIRDSVQRVIDAEIEKGMQSGSFYSGFQARAEKVKNDFVDFLIQANRSGLKVAGYGAAAKGNTLINFAGVKRDLLAFVVDKNPAKQGKWLPGSRIPIVEEETLKEEKPDYIVILPWNLKVEIMEQLAFAKNWGCKFVTAVPELAVFE